MFSAEVPFPDGSVDGFSYLSSVAGSDLFNGFGSSIGSD